jgi:hypothetical protein
MKRTLVPLLLLIIFLISLTVPLTQDPSLKSHASASAISYLVTNYNRTIGLIPEIPHGNTYWIYSDNLLASIVLSSHPENKTLIDIASNISTTMDRYITNLAHGANQYLVFYSGIGAFNASGNYDLANDGGATISITLNNGSLPLDPSSYGDIALLEAIYYQYHRDHSNASRYFQLGRAMYDGIGIKDTVFTSGPEAGIYQTYKLALFILAARVLEESIPDNATSILTSQQATNGGFSTGYRYQGGTLESAGSTNTETTSLAILALSYPPSLTQASILLYAAEIVAATALLAIIVTLAVIAKRRRPRSVRS